MTKIVQYLDCLEVSRSYEPDELARLQDAYDSARKLLELSDITLTAGAGAAVVAELRANVPWGDRGYWFTIGG